MSTNRSLGTGQAEPVRPSAPSGVLCMGRVYCDLVFSGLERLPTLGTEVFADELSLHGGGGAWITATWLAGLGRATSICAMLPASPFGTLLRADAERCGLDLSDCRQAEDGEPQLTVALVAQGDRAFLTRRPGAALPPQLHADALCRPGLTHLHISELATLLEYPQLPALARRAGLTVSLDCGWDEAALQRDDLAVHLQLVDVFMPNEAEFAALPNEALSHLPLLVLKRGRGGASARLRDAAGERWVRMPTGPLEPMDTTGAGDAFNAGFLHTWLATRSLDQALQSGNRCGALAVMQRGGGCHRTIPTDPEHAPAG